MKNGVTKIMNNTPQTLNRHPFYGLELDNYQKQFRDNIWNDKYNIVFCNAKAGSGKTLIATATAELLVHIKGYKGIVYIASPTQEQKQGYLAGSIEEKSEPYFEPFYQALNKLGVNTNVALKKTVNGKEIGYIECLTHTFLRGCNFEDKVVIIDECQNYYGDELKKVLTRIHDSCKVIVIGHTGQIDLFHNPENSGFKIYLDNFATQDYCAVCELNKNYRGKISTFADEVKIN